MRNLMRQLCYSLFLSFFFLPSRVTSEVGWATPKKKKKKKREREKKKIKLPHPHPPSPPLSSSSLFSSLPHPLWKTKRHQSSELSVFKRPAIEPCPSPSPGTAESTGRSTSLGEVRASAEIKALILWFPAAGQKEWVEGSTSKDWDKERQRWVLITAARWRHNTAHTWNYNCRKHTPTAGDKKKKR